jgi:SAM-dependent methyltransferase
MREAGKMRTFRPESFYKTSIGGQVLDIRRGDDLCVPHAMPFDKEQGEANDILNYFEAESFDCVHSFHYLEHMFDPRKSLGDWWKLVKPGGFLSTVVPDEDLYEQGNWPSLFNVDHKSTFRISRDSSWTPASYNLTAFFLGVPIDQTLGELSLK